MSEFTVKFKAVFGQQHSRPAAAAKEKVSPAVPCAPPVTKTARALALAHKIDAAIAAGQLRDEAHAAEVLGQSRSHISHIMHLLLLAPEIQKDIFLGRRVISARKLRSVSRITSWEDQLAALESLNTA